MISFLLAYIFIGVKSCCYFFYFLYLYCQIPEGNGSGVVWDDVGHIVTNYHGENQWRKYNLMLILNFIVLPKQ